jgi:hypothetical protein
MKKIVLSALAALTLGSVAANAGDLKLYQDANGQVFTQAGEGRTALKTPTSVFSNADKFKVSGQVFVGYKYTNYDDYANTAVESDQGFEVRRGYFQVKAYLLDDPKSYYRVTFDMKQNTNFDGGSLDVRAKYAYLNLNEVLPATSFEIGLAHRPWHDYEEHNSWLYRSISEILIENKNSAHLSSSADYGVMAKTRTKYLDADIGIFNGEGYHAPQNSNGMSFEWRFTGHLLGTHGHPEKNTYLDASFFGQINQKHNTKDNLGVVLVNPEDLKFYGFHTVYNQPSFLLSAQYVTSTDTSDVATHTSNGSGDGYSVNGEIRLGDDHQYKLLAKYDNWTPKAVSGATEYTRITEIVGVAWKQNKNVEWVANATINDDDNNQYGSATGGSTANGTAYMVTAEINF